MNSPTGPRAADEHDDLARALAVDLRDSMVDLAAGGYTRATLAMLTRNLHRSVVSILGATITVQPEGDTSEYGRRDTPPQAHRQGPSRSGAVPVTINLVPRPIQTHEIAAALGVPLEDSVPGVIGSVVLYAAEVDAFHDLAADLARALGLARQDLNEHHPFPDAPVEPSLSALQDFSVVNRALGVLLHRGYTLPSARAELDRRAEHAGIGLVAAAQAVLSGIVR